MKLIFKPQVSRDQYFTASYNQLARWASYWYQIKLVLETGGSSVIEIGVGNGVVSDYLKKTGLKVTTVDIDPQLNPDNICSVNALAKVFNENSFDVVLCAEVLEHLPFPYFEEALNAVSIISKNHVIISLPNFGLNLAFSLPMIGAKVLHLAHPFPPRHEFDGEHYWEIGKKGFSLKLIVKTLEKYFIVTKQFISPQNPYHQFFVLKKRLPKVCFCETTA